MVKWTSELDQVLLIKVLEACEVRPSQKEFEDMAKTWPDHFERPTARAISEHLWVIKKSAKATMGDKAAKNASEKSTPKSTPKKIGKATTPKNTPTKTPTKVKGGSGTKRRRVVEEEEDDNPDSSDGVEFAVKNEDADVEPALKAEDPDDTFGDGSQMSQTPKKSHAPKSSKPAAADEAGLMYDGASMEAI